MIQKSSQTDMWKRFLWTLVGLTSISTIGILAGMVYFSSQVQRLPDWFDQSRVTSASTSVSNNTQTIPVKPVTAQQVWMRVQNTPHIPGKYTPEGFPWKQVDLNAQELNAVLFNNFPNQKNLSSPDPIQNILHSSLQNSQVRIADGNITVGALVNIGKISQKLGNKNQRHNAFENLSNLTNFSNIFSHKYTNIYVEIQGKPIVTPNQAIALSDDARIKLANFNFSIQEFAQYTGIPETILRDRLGFSSTKNPDVPGRMIVPMMINTVEVIGDKLRLGGSQIPS